MRAAHARLTLAAVRAILDEIPDTQRSALLLVCVEGLSYREAAEVQGVPIGTVMSRLARARQTVIERLDGVPAPAADVLEAANA